MTRAGGSSRTDRTGSPASALCGGNLAAGFPGLNAPPTRVDSGRRPSGGPALRFPSPRTASRPTDPEGVSHIGPPPRPVGPRAPTHPAGPAPGIAAALPARAATSVLSAAGFPGSRLSADAPVAGMCASPATGFLGSRASTHPFDPLLRIPKPRASGYRFPGSRASAHSFDVGSVLCLAARFPGSRTPTHSPDRSCPALPPRPAVRPSADAFGDEVGRATLGLATVPNPGEVARGSSRSPLAVRLPSLRPAPGASGSLRTQRAGLAPGFPSPCPTPRAPGSLRTPRAGLAPQLLGPRAPLDPSGPARCRSSRSPSRRDLALGPSFNDSTG